MKRKAPTVRARSQKVIERDILTSHSPNSLRNRSEHDVCGACLLPVESDEQVGLVENCCHIFHFDCVDRWSQTENTCPQCKVRFFWLASYSPSGKRESLRKVDRKDQEGEDDEAYEDISVCERCKEVGDESQLLLCDGMHGTCNSSYHIQCVGLTAVPRGSWFCPDCTERGFDVDSKGLRGKAKGEAASTARASNANTIPPEALSAKEASSSSSVEPLRAAIVSAAAEAVAETRRRITREGRGRGLPSQLRLNALACVTPAVEVPTFDLSVQRPASATGSGSGTEGVFASFVQKRRAKLAASASSSDPSTSFITLNPTYENDFMGSKA